VKTRKYANFRIIVVLSLLFFALATISASSAATPLYVNGDTGDDAWDGTSATYTTGIIGPMKTIQNAIDAVDPDGTVNVADGTYTENVVIDKNVNLVGQSQNGTVIDGNGVGSVIYVKSGATVNISNFTIKNGYAEYGGGIINGGALTVTNCNVQQNTATYGGGITNYGGTLTINNCNIQQNNAAGTDAYGGGITSYVGKLTIKDSNISQNHANVGGGGIYTDRSTITIINSVFNNNVASRLYNDAYGGAMYTILGNLTINGSTFSNNIATYGGGILAHSTNWEVYDSIFTGNIANAHGGAIRHDYATLSIYRTTFDGNSANYYGGGISNYMGTVNVYSSTFLNNVASTGGAVLSYYGTTVVKFCRIIGNSDYDVYNEAGDHVNARYNWWGSNNPDFDDRVTGDVDVNPWLVMVYITNPITIQQGQTSVLTADFRYDSEGTFHDPANGHLPDGTLVKFTTNLGNVGSKYVFIGTLNGIATTILRGDEAAGEALTSAILDSQSLTATVTITPATDNGNQNENESPNSTVNAATETTTKRTIGMQKTGLPIAGLMLAILAVFGGLATSKRK